MVKKLLNFVIYSNCWIALGALAALEQTRSILNEAFRLDLLSLFIFSATLVIYAVHRIIGIQNMASFFTNERFQVIATYRSHIFIYGVIGLIVSAYCFLNLDLYVQLFLIAPSILSLAYVLPVFGKGKRLRDYHYIKIFTIAIVWGWLTVLLPFWYQGLPFVEEVWYLFVERVFFVFAITLPFDIRDLEVDKRKGVRTLPSILGIKKTIQVGFSLLFAAFIISLLLYLDSYYTLPVFIMLTISYLLTGFLIQWSNPSRHDYFFSGLMDGTLVFQGILTICASLF